MAGMTVVEALEVLAVSGAVRANYSNALAKLLFDRLSSGMALSDAVQSLPDVPPVLPAAIRAGERTSNLIQAIDEYLRFDDLVQRLKSKAISSSIYPGIVAGLGFSISVFLLVFVLPSFSRMYLNIRGSVSGAAALMMGLSRFASTYQPEILITVGIAMAAIVYSILTGELLSWVRQLAAANTSLRARIRDFHLAMTYQALSLLLKGGYPMAQSLEIAAQSSTSIEIAHALDLSRGRVLIGHSTSESLHAHGLCDEVGRRLLFSAERNGQFDQASAAVSGIYRDRFEAFIERITRVVEPVLLLLVALVVGALVVMMYLPIVEISTQTR
jgi:general secretion pathway protein F